MSFGPEPEKAHVAVIVSSEGMNPEDLRNFIGLAPDSYARAGTRNVHGRSRVNGRLVVAPVPALYNVWRIESGLPETTPVAEQVRALRDRLTRCVAALRAISVREGVKLTIGAQGNRFSFSLSAEDVAWTREIGAGMDLELWPGKIQRPAVTVSGGKRERRLSRVRLRLLAPVGEERPFQDFDTGLPLDSQPMVHLAALTALVHEGRVPADRLRAGRAEVVYEVLGREAETEIDEATVEELADLRASLTVVFEVNPAEWS